ncbi:NCS1 family nucleobase:cation symporter-1 [Cricetibacter osteomyelitidis]|uniref:NCS1 family nucleobase:cation symporter-1 n=1 Tax=Cricetibacter osteomyelitidis TaxID=1521931 RepID=A0A4R2T4G1_9PAST|nr:NCS1 family transporter [Cricetibacter osteomyelitidis]TCP96206.1 NCS1 family nucleobase:cation symporter-1 [Cricetibacter osteomyelitidis]
MTDKTDLSPIPAHKRIMGLPSYLFLWLGGCVSIGTFALGSGQLEKGLNLTQAFTAMLIGSLILIVCLCLNDQFSYKTGAPYAVQLKSAFGTKGNILPAMLRGLPAIVWYGVQSWLGGSAINQISISLFDYDNTVLFFLLFQLLQIIISMTGFHGLKWLENIGACVIVASLAYMFYVCMNKYGGVIEANLINKEGTWGIPFISAIVAFFGVNVTVMLNAGDYVRELKPGYSSTKRGTVYFLAMVPTTVFMGIIGLMISSATGIANPINAFAQAADNKVLVTITLVFILFAQMTTNLASNVIPPTYALMDAFKIKHKTAVVVVGILAIATCPWLLTSDKSAAGLDIFVLLYTVFFSPIFAVLLVDYYIMHKRKVDIDELYNEDGNRQGVNWAAIVAISVGAVIGLVNADISFLTATIPSGIVYYICMKTLPSCKRFREGTILAESAVK